MRSTVRFALEAVAPPLFRYVAARFAGHAQAGSAVAGATAGGAATVRVGAAGLDLTFLVMLAPLGGAGLLLLLRTTRTCARDVASGLAAEQRTPH